MTLSADDRRPARRIDGWLAAILLYALALRLYLCWNAPHGFNADEAANVWNAWCLLHHGTDEWGNHWPIVALRAFNDYRSTTYLYSLLPWQAVAGTSEFVSRLPAALSGMLTATLLVDIGRRLWSFRVGWIAAAFLAIAPLSLVTSLWAHEASLAPTLMAAALDALLWAGWPLTDSNCTPNVRRSIVAGGAVGTALYGYAALRLSLPLLLLALLIAQTRPLLRVLKTSQGQHAVAGLLIAASLVAAPLIYRHATDPMLGIRAKETHETQQTPVQQIERVAGQYVSHFGPRFLFIKLNDVVQLLAGPPGSGALQWFWLPPLLFGAGVTARRLSTSASACTLAAMLLSYPLVSALFHTTDQPHTMYSNVGILPLCLLAAIGCDAAVRSMREQLRLRQIVVGVYAIVALCSHVDLIVRFCAWEKSPPQLLARNNDLMQACDQLQPVLDRCDAVFISGNFTFPYEVTLLGLHYDPARWFADPKRYEVPTTTLVTKLTCARYGKIHFVYEQQTAQAELQALPAGSRVVMFLRQDELPLAAGHDPVGAITVGGLIRLATFQFVR